MKKIILLLLLAPLSMIAQETYVIKGQLGKLNSPSKLYLTYTENGEQKTDSVLLKEGTFSFSGKSKSINQAVLVLDYKGVGFKNLNRNSAVEVLPIYLVKGTTLITSKDSLSKAKISGNKTNEDAQHFSELLKPVNNKILALNKEYEAAAPERKTSQDFIQSLQNRYQEYMDERNNLIKQFIEKNPDSFISLIALQTMAGPNPEVAKIDPLFQSLSSRIKSTEQAQAFKAMLDGERNTSVGSTAQDFTQNDVNGKPVKLSDFRGKYVLLDFWASWCGPCRQENPNVVKAYNAFKNKNFTVLGVSLDRESGKEAWLNAIASDQLTWTQVSDLKFWKNEVAVQYGIKSIPQNFLIDPNGKIIAKNLRGEELQSFLAQVLK